MRIGPSAIMVIIGTPFASGAYLLVVTSMMAVVREIATFAGIRMA